METDKSYKYFDFEKNGIFIGNSNKIKEWSNSGKDEDKALDKVRLMLKNYLELDNVSFLFGSGSSIHLGSVSIRNIPREIEDYISVDYQSKIEKNTDKIKSLFKETVITLQKESKNSLEKVVGEDLYIDKRGWKFKIEDDLVIDNESDEIYLEFETLLNYLIAKSFILEKENKKKEQKITDELISALKTGLFNICNIDILDNSSKVIEKKKKSKFNHDNEHATILETKNKYFFHEKFLKSLLQRPLNLRRANIFTANYDLAFEYSFGRLGIHYIDGFLGFHKRFFKPETFNFDYFYPGSTTTGKVQRIEKVVRYFKLHGSISWVNSNKKDANNLYGIEEKPIELIDKLEQKGEIIIYPSAVKKSYTLDLPYSELFRQFSSTINQSQSVLFTIGYSFADEHFNDIIYQALSNPTFTLIIVNLGSKRSQYIENLKSLNDSRIIILQGPFFGDFLTFSDMLMPDFTGIDTASKVAETLNKIGSMSNTQNEEE